MRSCISITRNIPWTSARHTRLREEETHCLSDTPILQERRNQRDQEQTTASYTFQTIAPEYVTKSLVPSWTLTINGGVTLVDQSGSTHSFISGKLGLATDYDRRTHVQMWVERRAIPSYYATGSPLISNLARFNVTYGVTRLVRLTAGAYYAYNETAPVKTFASRTARGSVALDYQLDGKHHAGTFARLHLLRTYWGPAL